MPPFDLVRTHTHTCVCIQGPTLGVVFCWICTIPGLELSPNNERNRLTGQLVEYKPPSAPITSSLPGWKRTRCSLLPLKRRTVGWSFGAPVMKLNGLLWNRIELGPRIELLPRPLLDKWNMDWMRIWNGWALNSKPASFPEGTRAQNCVSRTRGGSTT